MSGDIIANRQCATHELNMRDLCRDFFAPQVGVQPKILLAHEYRNRTISTGGNLAKESKRKGPIGTEVRKNNLRPCRVGHNKSAPFGEKKGLRHMNSISETCGKATAQSQTEKLLKASDYIFGGKNISFMSVGIAIALSIATALCLYVAWGLVRCFYLNQGDVTSTPVVPLLDCFGVSIGSILYFHPYNILLLSWESLALSAPWFFISILLTRWLLKRALESHLPAFVWIVLDIVLATAVWLIPHAVMFYVSCLFYGEFVILPEFYLTIENRALYVKNPAFCALSTYLPSLVWTFSLIPSITCQARSLFLRMAKRIREAEWVRRTPGDFEIAIDESQQEVSGWLYRLRLIAAGWGRLFGYDFFISYAWIDSRLYAESLLERLTGPPHNFRCFIDSKEMGGGEAWRRAVYKALGRSSVLLLTASEQALKREAVFQEVRHFSRLGRPILPIDIDGRVESMEPGHRLYILLEQRIRTTEPGGDEALAGGEASNDVVEYCAKSFDFVRVSRMRAMVLASLVAFFMLLSAISIERFVAERSANSRSKGQFLASTAVLELESNPELAFLLARKASDRGETPAIRRAVYRLGNALPNLQLLQQATYNSPVFLSEIDADRVVAVGGSYAHLLEGPSLDRYHSPADLFENNGPLLPPASVLAAASHPEMPVLFIGDNIGGITRFDWSSGEVDRLVLENDFDIPALAVLDRKGRWLAVAKRDSFSRHKLCLMDADTREQDCMEVDISGWIKRMVVSRKKRVLFISTTHDSLQKAAYGQNESGRMFFDPKRLDVVHGSPKHPDRLAFSDDEKYLAVTSDKHLDVVSIEEEAPVFSIDIDDGISAVVFSPDNKRIALAQYSGETQIWSLDTMQLAFSFQNSMNRSSVILRFFPEGDRLLAINADGLLSVWNVSESVSTIAKHTAPGRILSITDGGSGGFVVFYESDDEAKPKLQDDTWHIPVPVGKLGISTAEPFRFKRSSDARQLALVSGGKVFHCSPGDEWKVFSGFSPGTRIKFGDFDSAERFWAISDERHVSVWDLDKGKKLEKWVPVPESDSVMSGEGTIKEQRRRYSEIISFAVSPHDDCGYAVLSGGSVCLMTMGILQKARLKSRSRVVSRAPKIGSATSRIDIAELVNVAIVSADSEVSAIDLDAELNIREDVNLPIVPEAFTLTERGELLAVAGRRVKENRSEEEVWVYILDGATLQIIDDSIKITGPVDEPDRKIALAYDRGSGKLVVAAGGDRYYSTTLSIPKLADRLRSIARRDFSPDEAFRFGLPYKPLPEPF